MNTQLSEKLGANNSIFDVKEQPSIRLSAFNFSRKHNTTLDIGGIYPVDFFSVYPNDKVDLKLRYMLDTLPLAVPPMTNYKVRTHWYFVKKSALWAGWNTFITGGRTGLDLKIPSLLNSFWGRTYSDISDFADAGIGEVTTSSLSGLPAYLGIPPRFGLNVSDGGHYLPFVRVSSTPENPTGVSARLNALPFMAYLKIFRHAYLPANLIQDNKFWFPDNLDDHWRINYDASNLLHLGLFSGNGSPTEPSYSIVPKSTDNCADLTCLRYAPFDMDYFTSSKPWLVRGGTETSLSSDIDISGLQIESAPGVSFVSLRAGPFMSAPSGVSKYLIQDGSGVCMTGPSAGTVSGSQTELGVYSDSISGALTLSGTASTSLSLTANTLRNLIAVSVWQERNALTNGNYNLLVQSHWGIKPREPDYEPLYIGGTSDYVQFSNVIQTSQTAGRQVLGQSASIGGATSGADVFSYKANDYGYIFGVMIISPEVSYSQGTSREFSDLNLEDQFTPEFASLGYQPILKQELFTSTNGTVNDSLFGYQTRFAYLKQRLNRISGLLAVSPDQDIMFSAYNQTRWFNNSPSLSLEFCTMAPYNIRRDFMAFPEYPLFRAQIASDVKLIRALPYQSSPNTFGF
ncbi:major capsid protein [Tortoise microvirus 103]|nr:major capsid protein [Tortoise microvirus 5]QCS37442.1 major capsid protein [Tortoise microvirus 103]